jgi:DNA-binding GntR family transcriptional regulator
MCRIPEQSLLFLKGTNNRMKKNGNEQERVYEAIKELILTMALKPDEAVTEVGLAEKLKVSRTPVREALNNLEKDGLIVTSNRRKRVYVLTIKELGDIFDLKINLEGSIARWATERGSKLQFRQLEKTLAEMELLSKKAKDIDEKEEKALLESWLKIDRQLHNTLFEMADNPKAVQVINNLNTQWHRLRIAIYALEGRIEKAYTEHENFVKAILEKDATGAETAMRLHLNNLKRELIKILNFFHYPA